MVPTPETPVNPPVLDARPDTTPTVSTAPTVPVAETPVILRWLMRVPPS